MPSRQTQARYGNIHRPSSLLLAAALALLLAACAGQPQTEALPGSVTVTSQLQADASNYVLTGTLELPAGQTASLEYNLNNGGWQPIDLDTDNTFSILLTLQDGQNNISLALTTSAGVRTQESVVVTATLEEPVVNEPDTENPQILITSADTSHQSTYVLTGAAVDDHSVESATYTLRDLDPVQLSLSSAGLFNASLQLIPGANPIQLTARDAAGNTGNHTFTVTYIPPISGVTISPMAAQPGRIVTISGTSFGDWDGTVEFGDVRAHVESWSDTEIKAVVPAGAYAWQDVTISREESSHTVNDFFAGLEVIDNTELRARLMSADDVGSALLLSGSNYELGSASESTLSATGPFSLYGARTGGDPITTLQLLSNLTNLRTSDSYGVMFQDLVMDIKGMQLLDPVGTDASGHQTGLREGITFMNVHFRSSYVGISNGFIMAGAPGNHDRMPQAIHMQDVRVESLALSLRAHEITVLDSEIAYSVTVQLAAEYGPLLITDSTITAQDPAAPTLVVLDGNSGTLVQGSQFTMTNAELHGEGTYARNQLTVRGLTVWSGVTSGTDGSIVLDDNIIEIDGPLTYIGLNHVVSNNILRLAGGIEARLQGTIQFTGNTVEFSGIDPDQHAFYFRPNGAALNIEFSGNTTTGSNQLFYFDKAGNGLGLTANITGNQFDADLAEAGNVAVVVGMHPPDSITTSGNTWGTLADAQAVLDLIEYVNSTAGVMTVAEF